MKFKLIPDWHKQCLTCHFCKETRSVKYKIELCDAAEDHERAEVSICNKCLLKHIHRL